MSLNGLITLSTLKVLNFPRISVLPPPSPLEAVYYDHLDKRADTTIKKSRTLAEV